MNSSDKGTCRLSASVETALRSNSPVVAFETTILTFGLPAPLNSEVAAGCERIARENGCVPATVALLDGEVRAGLSSDEIAFFCSRDPATQKVNLQNFAAVLHRRQAGALTVAASLQVAALAGIRVFATGGIGGVHRGFAQVPDISSDLVALSRFPVITVCAGAKSILDVPATLEALETLGVPVVGYRTDVFPLFHARDSGHKLDISFDDPQQLAEFALTHWRYSNSAVLVVTPIPGEQAIPRKQLDSWIDAALQQSRVQQVTGKKMTPFLLAELEKLSDGKTLEANLALIYNNAAVASELARELAQLQSQ